MQCSRPCSHAQGAAHVQLYIAQCDCTTVGPEPACERRAAAAMQRLTAIARNAWWKAALKGYMVGCHNESQVRAAAGRDHAGQMTQDQMATQTACKAGRLWAHQHLSELARGRGAAARDHTGQLTSACMVNQLQTCTCMKQWHVVGSSAHLGELAGGRAAAAGGHALPEEGVVPRLRCVVEDRLWVAAFPAVLHNLHASGCESNGVQCAEQVKTANSCAHSNATARVEQMRCWAMQCRAMLGDAMQSDAGRHNQMHVQLASQRSALCTRYTVSYRVSLCWDCTSTSRTEAGAAVPHLFELLLLPVRALDLLVHVVDIRAVVLAPVELHRLLQRVVHPSAGIVSCSLWNVIMWACMQGSARLWPTWTTKVRLTYCIICRPHRST